MSMLRRLSVVEQIAGHLRDELGRGRWSGIMPGAIHLAAELAASSKTTEAALRLLETGGLLCGRGPGRSRSIVASPAAAPRSALRIAILLYDELSRDNSMSMQVALEIHQAMDRAGFDLFFCSKTQAGLRFDPRQIRRYVEQTPADAWIVCVGTRELLEWFSSHSVPAIALFGRRRGLPIAGVGADKVPAYVGVTRELIRLGHRRIVMCCRKLRRLPVPSTAMRRSRPSAEWITSPA